MSDISQLLIETSKEINRERTILMANQLAEIVKEYPEMAQFLNNRLTVKVSVGFERYRNDKYARTVIVGKHSYEMDYRPPSLKTIISFFFFDIKQWFKRRTEKLK